MTKLTRHNSFNDLKQNAKSKNPKGVNNFGVKSELADFLGLLSKKMVSTLKPSNAKS